MFWLYDSHLTTHKFRSDISFLKTYFADLQTKLKREDEEPWVDMQFSQVLLNSFISTIHFIILYLLLVVFSLFLRRAIASTI